METVFCETSLHASGVSFFFYFCASIRPVLGCISTAGMSSKRFLMPVKNMYLMSIFTSHAKQAKNVCMRGLCCDILYQPVHRRILSQRIFRSHLNAHFIFKAPHFPRTALVETSNAPTSSQHS